MVSPKTTKVGFVCIFIAVCLMAFVSPNLKAEMLDEQQKALLGEWKGEWPGIYGDTSTLTIHEIDTQKGKARCTYNLFQKDRGRSDFEIMADFIPGPNPQLEFRVRKNDFKCILKGEELHVSFVGEVRGAPWSNATIMKKTAK